MKVNLRKAPMTKSIEQAGIESSVKKNRRINTKSKGLCVSRPKK